MVIVSYAELLMESLGEDHTAREQISQILNAANRSFALTRQLLAFSRKQVLAPSVIDCNALISDTSNMVRRLISENIDLRCELAPGLWPVKADPDQIVQMIVNLCVNSRDAMPDGGSILVATRNHTEQGRVEISVSDTGAGIPPEIQKKIFEPFFTTKQPGKGTGLGLATVYGMVQQSGGSIRLDSTPGQGTTFVISLPRCVQTEAAPEPPARKPLSAERAIILVVEDEETLRQAMLKQLRAQGYPALAAADGHEALSILSRTPQIGIVICDIVMPRMGGRELARLAAQQHPDLRMIFMSGHPDQAQQLADSAVQAVFLPKPFDAQALLAAIAELHPSPRFARGLAVAQGEALSSLVQ
jgi:two-component system cell cycle sensor histidine kinase/response regulator CckA